MGVLTISQIGNSEGAIFPKEFLAKLRVGKGDKVYYTETPDGMMLSAYDPAFEQEMKAAEDIMHRYRNTLKKLAE